MPTPPLPIIMLMLLFLLLLLLPILLLEFQPKARAGDQMILLKLPRKPLELVVLGVCQEVRRRPNEQEEGRVDSEEDIDYIEDEFGSNITILNEQDESLNVSQIEKGLQELQGDEAETTMPEEREIMDTKDSAVEYIVTASSLVHLLCLSHRLHYWTSSAPYWTTSNTSTALDTAWSRPFKPNPSQPKKRIATSTKQFVKMIPAAWLSDEQWEKVKISPHVSVWKLPLFSHKMVGLCLLHSTLLPQFYFNLNQHPCPPLMPSIFKRAFLSLFLPLFLLLFLPIFLPLILSFQILGPALFLPSLYRINMCYISASSYVKG